MIQRLRRKLVAIMMTIITIFLVVILGALFYSNKVNYRERSLAVLRSAIQENYPDNTPPPRRNETPLLIVNVKTDGSIEIVRNQLLNIDDAEVETLITELSGISATIEHPDGLPAATSAKTPDGRPGTSSAKASDDPPGNPSHTSSTTGVLTERHLRYLSEKRGSGGTIRYAFADIYDEQNALQSQLVNSVIIGVCAFSGFFLFSMLLSRWAVKPVKDAWEQQQQFVADASHELKTPLTVILSNANMMIRPPSNLDAKNHQRTTYIQAEASRMKQLVENLLLLARSDAGGNAGHAAATHQPLDFSYLVNQSVVTFEPVAFDMGKQISNKIEDNIILSGAEQELRQLIAILLDNACKYSSPGGSIQVSLTNSGAKKKEALLSITNEGTPLTKEEQTLIFHRFFRADPSRSNTPGYGLGLSIAQSIVIAHGGRIECTSDGTHKNCFTVGLPI